MANNREGSNKGNRNSQFKGIATLKGHIVFEEKIRDANVARGIMMDEIKDIKKVFKEMERLVKAEEKKGLYADNRVMDAELDRLYCDVAELCFGFIDPWLSLKTEQILAIENNVDMNTVN